MKIAGSTVLVTGGAGGLGEAVVRKLVGDGSSVVIADLADERSESLVDEFGKHVRYVRTDVTDENSVRAALEAAGEFGPIRGTVIAHGGGGVVEKLVGRDGQPAALAGFEKTISVYLTGTYNVVRLAAAAMAGNEPDQGGERGSIVMTSSIAAYEGQIGQSAYAVAKGGVVSLTLSAARDLGSLGIRVNTIAPGTMGTPIMRSVGDAMIGKITEAIPFPKRLGETAEYAALASHLLENSYINGEVVRLDGALRFAPR
jgi:NAD(P)-dependent dehydrogenase (short-subunit alcohol dehydrogenase family)